MHPLGLLTLFALAYALLVAMLTASLYRSMRRPSRFTYGAALARGFATEPGELGLDAQDVVLRDASGFDTAAWIIAGRDPQGPTIIMLHGYARSRYSTLELAPAFIDHAARLVLLDLPGHGESAAPCSTAGVNEYRDVLGFAEQVRDGARPILLYGRSMGAGIALAAAAEAPEVFAGVIAEGAYRTWHEPIRRRMRLRRLPAEPMVTLAGLAFRVLMGTLSSYDRTALAERVRCPLLVLHGTDDPVCLIDDARVIAAAAPDATLIEFPGGLHLNLHTHDEERHSDALAAFFERLRSHEPKPAPTESLHA